MVKKPAVAVEHFKPFKPFPYMLSFLRPLTALFSLSEAGLLRVRVVVLVASLISYRKGSAVLRGGARRRQLPEVIIRRLGRVMDGGLRWTSYSPPPPHTGLSLTLSVSLPSFTSHLCTPAARLAPLRMIYLLRRPHSLSSLLHHPTYLSNFPVPLPLPALSFLCIVCQSVIFLGSLIIGLTNTTFPNFPLNTLDTQSSSRFRIHIITTFTSSHLFNAVTVLLTTHLSQQFPNYI